MLNYFALFSAAAVRAGVAFYTAFIIIWDLVAIILWKNMFNNMEVNHRFGE